jgi:sugar lactone lactonase YvrE
MKILNKVRAILGEGPIWHEKRQCFFWVDIDNRHIHSYDINSEKTATWDLPDIVTCIVKAEDGHLIAALSHQLIHYNLDTNDIKILYDAKELSPKVRFNDGKVDGMGRLWIGTMDLDEKSPLGNLYCFEKGIFSLKDSGFTIANGIGWNLDKTSMYFTDSSQYAIFVYDFNLTLGTLTNRRVFTTIPKELGLPDGLCIDINGNIWGAHFGGTCMSCYDPHGNLIKRIEMPAQNITSCCFGGKSAKTLFVTSASRGCNMSLKKHENAGFSFLFNELATGQYEHEYIL